MKEPIKPVKPYKPQIPVEPLKYIQKMVMLPKPTHLQSLSKYLETISNLNLSTDNIIIKIEDNYDNYDNDDDYYGETINFYYYNKIENLNYQKEIVLYNKKLKNYNNIKLPKYYKDMKEYKVKLEKYKKELEEYSDFIKINKIKALKEELDNLQNGSI